MASEIRLLTTRGREELIEHFYFYDGECPIVEGVITIPLDRPEWIQRAYLKGYRLDPVSEELLTIDEALAGGRAASPEPESTESAGEEVEGSDSGGLPADEDGVRESEPESGEGDAGPVLDDSIGNDTTEG